MEFTAYIITGIILFIIGFTFYNVGKVEGKKEPFYTKEIVHPTIRIETIKGVSDTTYIYKF